ncbi:MAG: hypothetical protein K6G09_03750 [Treponema sp.]|nr:hypothetical protein [Treponema sp.]
MPEKKTFEVIKKDTQADFLKRIENLTKEIKFGSITIHVEPNFISFVRFSILFKKSA